jgi:hypothetical protein
MTAKGVLVSMSAFLALVACVLFVLAAFGVSFAGVGILALGLAFFAAAHVV